MTTPTAVLGWDTPHHQWLAARRRGIGASDVATLLGLSEYGDTPWQLWTEKTGRLAPAPLDNEAIQCGRELEPWLINQASTLLDQGVSRTPHMLYAHTSEDWRQCSPDAFAEDGSLVEAKTAGIASYSRPKDWDNDGIPLGYELQARWQMHVMNRDRVYFIALVAGLGRVVRTVERHLPTENDLVEQVSEWRKLYIENDAEPPVSANDSDILTRFYAPDGQVADLTGTDAVAWALAYKEARTAESAAKKAKQEPAAQLKALMGTRTVAKADDKIIATWNPVRGDVDWQKIAEDLAAQAGIPLPDPETYRKPSTRSLLIKL